MPSPPPTPSASSDPSDSPESPGSSSRLRRAQAKEPKGATAELVPRPPGEAGGHTVQDWEQPAPPATKLTLSDAAVLPSRPEALGQVLPVLEFLAPEVQAVYLRPASPRTAPSPATSEAPSVVRAVREEGRARPLASEESGALPLEGNDTLADLITRIVSGLLERSLHESVTAAVRALAPRMIIRFPPSQVATEEADVDAQPPAAVDQAVADAAADKTEGTAAT